MKIGDKVTSSGYPGVIVGTCGETPYGYCPDGMVIVRLPGGVAVVSNGDCVAQDDFNSELTPEGEQMVIPGCERNAAPGKTQLDLF